MSFEPVFYATWLPGVSKEFTLNTSDTVSFQPQDLPLGTVGVCDQLSKWCDGTMVRSGWTVLVCARGCNYEFVFFFNFSPINLK